MNRELLLNSKATIKEALKQLDLSAEKILFIVNQNDKLLGSLSDGDIRRAILKNMDLNSTIDSVYNQNPKYLEKSKYSLDHCKSILIENKIDVVPIVDENHTIFDLKVWNTVFDEKKADVLQQSKIDVPIIIMAGGKGTRMAPFTKVLPKPLIPIGEETILEHIFNEFGEYCHNNYILTLNYKGAMIEAYFKSINKNYNLSYVWEKDFYGTAGSLSLLSEEIDRTFIVSNCDVIVKADYQKVYKFHKSNNAALTVLSSIQHYHIPYGVIEHENGGMINNIIEKPEYTFNINTGVYMLEPEVFNYIPSNKIYNMPDLIFDLIKNNKNVLMYPVNEKNYIDIGQWDEYKSALERLKTN